MINNKIYRIFAATVIFCAACVVFLAKPCMAKTRVHTYRKGFTYQKLDEEIIHRIQGKSYKKGAKISLNRLRYLRIRYVDFEGNMQSGEMIVNKKIALRTLKVFYQLYKIKYPIQKMKDQWQITTHLHLIIVLWQILKSCQITAWGLP